MLTEEDILIRTLTLPPSCVFQLDESQSAGERLLVKTAVEYMNLFKGYSPQPDDSEDAERYPEGYTAPPKKEEPVYTGKVGKEQPGHKLALVLQGAAGTGKTTLLRVILRHLTWEGVSLQLLAPTRRALLRLREVFAMDPTLSEVVEKGTSLHAFIYGGPSEEGQCPTCSKWSLDLAEVPLEGNDKTCPFCSGIFPLMTPMELRLTWIPPFPADGGVLRWDRGRCGRVFDD